MRLEKCGVSEEFGAGDSNSALSSRSDNGPTCERLVRPRRSTRDGVTTAAFPPRDPVIDLLSGMVMGSSHK